jgi:hypothetical protein
MADNDGRQQTTAAGQRTHQSGPTSSDLPDKEEIAAADARQGMRAAGSRRGLPMQLRLGARS